MADRAFRVVESRLSKTTIAQLVEILKVGRLTLANHLEDFPVDEDIRTRIEAQVSLYDGTYSDDQVRIHPTESNFGSESDPEKNRKEIKAKLVALLELDPDLVPNSGRLQRA